MENGKPASSVMSWIVPSVLTIFAAIFLFARFRAGDAYIAFFEDDYFYYLTIARNIVGGHGSTFDGIHRTNGYHPLWMVVNVCLFALFNGRSFFLVLLLIMLGSVLLTYFGLAKCLVRYLSANTSAYCAAFIAAEFLLMVGSGMEIVLTVPLLAWFCWYRLSYFQWTPLRACFYGFFASLVILSRLDSILFVVPLCILELLVVRTIPLASKVKAITGFFAGSLPVVAYLVMNFLLFHTLVPISSTAKQLRTTNMPTVIGLRTAVLNNWPIPSQLGRPVAFGIFVAAIFLIFGGRSRLAQRDQPLVWALLLFPFLQLGALSLLSDWPLWIWYLYPFLTAALGVFLILGTRQETWWIKGSRFAPAIIALAAFLVAARSAAHAIQVAIHPKDQQYEIYYASRDLQTFAATHPGIYAMGDRAGMIGYMLHDPVVQLEGLVMDKAFLQNIRKERDLSETLKSYNVRYYIANNPESLNGCLSVREPVQAGPTSHTMHGTFCQ